MDIVAKVNDDFDPEYICKMKSSEIDAVLGKSYGGGYSRHKVGDEVDLKVGPNFRSEMKDLAKTLEQAHSRLSILMNTLEKFKALSDKLDSN